MTMLLDPPAPAPGPLSPAPEADALPSSPTRAAWERPALVVLLGLSAVLYLWNLSASGWANGFYSAAAQAGSQSWKAFFYGASDAAGSITVDKPPLALWPMALSVRVFGLSSWSILAPQALMGVATVGTIYATVRRRASAGAALLAGAVMALTPVATLMFRFNNPEALLVLLMALAAYTALRAIEDGRTRWMVLTGALVGLGFLTKQLQVLLVVPGFALAFAIAGPGTIARRARGLAIAGLAIIGSAGWWIAVVELVPERMRPYIGGSQENSFLELTFGYNGLGRLTGDETGSVGGGGGMNPMWGETGLTRLFDGQSGGQIAWLIPAALVLLVSGLWITRRRGRTDAARAGLIVFGGWLLVTGLAFSFMAGIYHDYYTVALAPGIAGLVGIGGHLLWSHRSRPAAIVTMAAITGGTAMWSAALLGRSPWAPWIGDAVLIAGLLAACAIAASPWLGAKVLSVATALALAACLGGPTAWSLETASHGHEGAIVTAGPTVASGMGFGRGPAGAGAFPGGGNQMMPGAPPTGNVPTGGGFPPGGPPGGFGGGGGAGGLLSVAEPSDAVVAALTEDADQYRWVAAAVGANSAAGYQLAAEESVMPIGGFNGTDPSPTLEQFQAWVAAGDVHWFIAGGLSGMGANGGSDTAQTIASWVESTFPSTTVDGVTLYDLTAGEA